jgi:transketolase
MRGVFLDKLFQQMHQDEKIFFLTADMGINLVEKFEEEFPERFMNVGIAEQNLIGVAAGLASSGMKPFVYTISNFLVHRCFEQIRNDLVIHQLPVVMIGTSTGFDNGPLGPTHHMVDDWGTLAGLSGIDIYAPFNEVSTDRIFDVVYRKTTPSYVRIAKGKGIDSPTPINPKKRSKSAVLTYGSACSFAAEFARTLQLDLIILEELGVGSFEALNEKCQNYSEIIVVEDHYSHSGMYSYLSQWVNSVEKQIRIRSISPTTYSLLAGFEFSDFQEKDIE